MLEENTSAYGLSVIPVRVAGINTLNCPRTLFYDKSRRTHEGNGGAQLICDITAAKIPMRHVGLPAVFIIKR